MFNSFGALAGWKSCAHRKRLSRIANERPLAATQAGWGWTRADQAHESHDSSTMPRGPPQPLYGGGQSCLAPTILGVATSARIEKPELMRPSEEVMASATGVRLLWRKNLEDTMDALEGPLGGGQRGQEKLRCFLPPGIYEWGVIAGIGEGANKPGGGQGFRLTPASTKWKHKTGLSLPTEFNL